LRGSRTGFTLVELLVATALTAVVAVVIASAFAAGFQVWKRVGREGMDNAVIVLEMIQKDLNNTQPCRLVPFKGGSEWVEIPTVISVPVTGGNQDQPGVVRYEFDSSSHGLQHVTRLLFIPGSESEKRETLLNDVGSITFSYGEAADGGTGVGAWESDWAGRTNTPRAVKVEMELRQGEDRIDLERIMVLPCWQ